MAGMGKRSIKAIQAAGGWQAVYAEKVSNEWVATAQPLALWAVIDDPDVEEGPFDEVHAFAPIGGLLEDLEGTDNLLGFAPPGVITPDWSEMAREYGEHKETGK